MTPTTCQRLGHSFKIRLDMIRATTGMQARKAPLSEAVVIRMPMVSQIKQIIGLRMAIRVRGLRFLPLIFSRRRLNRKQRLIKRKAVTKRQEIKARSLTCAVIDLVKIKLSPKRISQVAAAKHPKMIYFSLSHLLNLDFHAYYSTFRKRLHQSEPKKQTSRLASLSYLISYQLRQFRLNQL